METVIFSGLFFILAWIFYHVAGTLRFPGVIAVLGYGLLYLWNRWGALRFSYEFQARHAAYLLTTLLVFGGCMLAGMYSRRRLKHSRIIWQVSEQRATFVARCLMIVGIVGGILWALDILRNLGGVSAVSSSNLSTIREQFVARTTTGIGQIGSLLYGCALPGLLLGMRQWLIVTSRGSTRRFLPPLLLCLAGVMGIVAFLSGGRQSVLAILVCIATVVLYGGWQFFSVLRRRLFLLVGLAAVILGVSYYLLVANQRATFGMADANYLLTWSASEYSDWFSRWSQALPPQVTTQIVALHGYFPYNLTGLAVWMDGIDQSNLGWGRFQGEHILRQLRRMGIELPFALSVNTDSEGIIAWPTAIGSMIADFGTVGALFALGWLGWLLGVQFGNLLNFGNFLRSPA